MSVESIQTTDKPIRKDFADYKGSLTKDFGFLATGAITMVGATIAGKEFIPEEPAAQGTAFITSATLTTGWWAKTLFDGAIREHINVSKKISDYEVGYRADRYVYRGDSFVAGGEKVKGGDNFYHIQLPQVSTPSLAPDLYDYSIREVRNRISDKKYSFVAISLPQTEQDFFGPAANLHSKDKLFAGKEVDVKNGQASAVVLTRREFEGLIISPQEAFLNAVEKLEDTRLSELVHQARVSTTSEERERSKTLMSSRLNQIMQHEVDLLFNTPEVALEVPEASLSENNEHLLPRIKRRHYPTLVIQKKDEDYFLVKLGQVNEPPIPLDRYLNMEGSSLERILGSDSKERNIQLSYFITKTIDTQPFDDLVRIRPTTRQELLREIKGTGASIQSVPDIEHQFEPKVFHGIMPIVRPLVTGLVLYAALNTGIRAVQYEQAGYVQPEDELKSQKIKFPENVPESGLVWKIEGNMPTERYYVTSTSHNFVDGEWKINNDLVEVTTSMPQPFAADSQVPHINLKRTEITSPFMETRFRIPTPEDTQIAGLSIKDASGRDIPYKLLFMTDGTKEVKLTTGLKGPLWVDIEASFIPYLSQIQATKSVDSLDVNKLSDRAKQTIREAESLPLPNFVLNLVTTLKKNYEYSINPPGANSVLGARSKEEMVNAIAQLSGLDCLIASTQEVLLSTTRPGDILNMAFGYIALPDHPQGAGGSFLRREAGHAFAIDTDGRIVDATPSKPAKDKNTQEYLEKLQGDSNGAAVNDNGEEQLWKNTQNHLRNFADASFGPAVRNKLEKQEKLQDAIRLSEILLAATTGVIILSIGGQKVKKELTRENIDTLLDQTVLAFYSTAAVNNAERFFEWLSWGNRGVSVSPRTNGAENKLAQLARIRETINRDRVAYYLQYPRTLERAARNQGLQLSGMEARKLRQFAKYLLS